MRARHPGRAILTALWAGWLSAGTLACEERIETTTGVVARVGTETLHASVVEMLAEREGLDPAAAQAQALDTLRLAQEWKASHDAADVIAPARARQVLAAARARLWLDEVFEPGHGPDAIDDDYLGRVRANSTLVAEVSRPRVHAICQLIVIPSASAARSEGGGRARLAPDTEEWRRGAQEYAAPIFAAARSWQPDLMPEENCALFIKFARRLDAPKHDEYQIRPEQGGYNLDSGSLSPRFVEAVRALPRAKTFSDPFHTEFGYHLVFVPSIREALLPPGSQPKVEYEAALDKALRAYSFQQWRHDVALPRRIAELRAKHVVRLAPGAGGPAGSSAPP